MPDWPWASLSLLQCILLLPVAGGSLYSLACLWTLARFKASTRCPRPELPSWPPVTLLKPIHGLEKGLEDNLRSACSQDYPDYQVVFSVQRHDDPALALLQRLEQEFGPARVDVVVDAAGTAPNGKIRNLLGAFPHARHDVLVISDSDVRLRPDYLKAIVAPLAAPGVGCACTFYRAVGAGKIYETLEQLSLNADFLPNLVFAHVTGASRFLLGASTALTRATLEEIGGLAALSDYLVEDFEMGRRILAAGKRIAIVPYFVDTVVDLGTPAQWWSHQLYWDQNTRAANASGLFGTLFVRAIPFAVLFAAVRRADPAGLAVLLAATTIRLAASGIFLSWGLGDWKGVRSLLLLPCRDLAGLVSWALAFLRPTGTWRGARFILTRDGRMVIPDEPAA
ncbi:MAG: bacteriohopanetetrol glucosamine biosynthesis glycosyltransferase HpnI [Acidobacteriota bacterium]|nr:bacteriohopanetetrol glucosamine biosynthesis glycosyltransferase HpnI [Acidobacteriota bacterium]